MRKGFLCCAALLVSSSAVQAQSFPHYGGNPGYPHPAQQHGYPPMPFHPAMAGAAAAYRPAAYPGYGPGAQMPQMPQMPGGSPFVPYPVPPQMMQRPMVPPQAMLPQAVPQQMLPQQALPQQALPQQMLPQQALPQQAAAPQAVPAQPVAQKVEVKAESKVASEGEKIAPPLTVTETVVEPFIADLPAEPQAVVVGGGNDGPSLSGARSGARENFSIFGDYLLSWFRRAGLPGGPLVTTGSSMNPTPGALGQTGTAALFGEDDLDDIDPRHGFRLGVSSWLDYDNRYSIDVQGFWIFEAEENFRAQSGPGGAPIITRPALNVAAPGGPTEAAFITSFPGLLAGSTTVDFNSELYGGEINTRWHTCLGRCFLAEGILGFRVVRLEEDLIIRDTLNPLTPGAVTFLGTPVVPGSTITDFDAFRTSNTFYGPQLGTQLRYACDWMTVDLFGKVGLGTTRQDVEIDGATTLTTPAGSQTAQGGLLAQQSNIGDRSRHVFGVVPEFGFNLGLNASDYVRLRAGYSALLWNRVVRPGDQIDRGVNPGQIPSDQGFGMTGGAPRPAFQFNDSYFWMQSLNFGVELHY